MDSIFFYTNQQIIAITKNVSVTEIHKFANVYLYSNGVYKRMKKQDYEVLSVKYYLDFYFYLLPNVKYFENIFLTALVFPKFNLL